MGRVHFGRDDQRIGVDVRDRAYPVRHDSSDGNWLTAWIDLRIRPFEGSFVGSWRAEFVGPFREQLERLYETLEGDAVLGPDWEGSLEVTLTGDGRGHIALHGTACADPRRVRGYGSNYHRSIGRTYRF